MIDTHTAIIGASGAGKTVTAKVQVEEMLHERRHLAIIDPLGVWWGLRSAFDGEGQGFDIPIFGGDHGDVQILPDQGGAIGAYIAGGMSAIIDLSGMDQRDGRIFMLGFMRALRKKPKVNFHLIVDEADEFAPQTAPDNYGFQLVEQMTWIAKRGRVAGFVLTVITQRPADISKAVLSQMQTIIAHQLIAPLDQKALDDYLKANGDPTVRKAVMTSLPGLDRGERWVYSPRAGVLERGITPLPSTFDSSRTPAPGETISEPKMLASIDLGEIRAALAPAPEPAALNDLPAADISAEILKRDEQIKLLKRHLAADNEKLGRLYRHFHQIRHHLRQVADIYEVELDAPTDAREDDEPGSSSVPSKGEPHEVSRSAGARPVKPEPSAPARQGDARNADGSPSPAALAIAELLDKINPAKVTWNQAATMTGRKASGGNFNSARKWLRGSGRIVEDGDTIRSSSPAPAGMTRSEAINLWKSVLTNPAPKMIDVFVERGAMSKEDLGSAIGAQPRGGNFNNGLAQLRRNGLLCDYGPAWIRLAEPLPGEAT